MNGQTKKQEAHEEIALHVYYKGQDITAAIPTSLDEGELLTAGLLRYKGQSCATVYAKTLGGMVVQATAYKQRIAEQCNYYDDRWTLSVY